MPPCAALEWLRIGMDFGDDRDVGAVARGLERCAHAGQTGAEDQDVVIVRHEPVVSPKSTATFRTLVRCEYRSISTSEA